MHPRNSCREECRVGASHTRLAHLHECCGTIARLHVGQLAIRLDGSFVHFLIAKIRTTTFLQPDQHQVGWYLYRRFSCASVSNEVKLHREPHLPTTRNKPFSWFHATRFPCHMAFGLQGGRRFSPKMAKMMPMIAASTSGRRSRDPRTWPVTIGRCINTASAFRCLLLIGVTLLSL